MNPQIIQDLQDQLRVLNDAVSNQTAAMTGLSKSLATSSASINKTTSSTIETTTVSNLNTQGTIKATNGAVALQRSSQQASELMKESAANFAQASTAAGTALRSFTEKLIGTEQGFTQFGDTFKGLGDAAFKIGKSFGLLGTLFGGLLKVGGEVAAHMAKQADAIGNAYDSIAQLGTAGTFTFDQVRKMGAGAGLTSFELDKLIKPMKSVQGGFSGLGGSQSEGIKRFGELVNVSKDVRNQFRHLGMGDEERNQALANYITTMNKQGAAFSGTLSSQRGLQKAAIAYTKNLYELADITGEDVATEQKKREELASSMETALAQNKWEQQLQAAQAKLKNGSPEEQQAAKAEIDRIEKEKAGFDQLNNEIRYAKLSREQGIALQRQYLTGKVDPASAQFAQQGVNVEEYLKALKTGRAKKGALADGLTEGVQNTLNTATPELIALSDQSTREALGLGNKETINRATQMAGKSYTELAAKAGVDVEKGMGSKDPAQLARDKEVETTRSLKLAVDDWEAAHNPFLGQTGILEKFSSYLGLAAAGLLAIAAIKGGKALFGLLRGGGTAAGAAGAAEGAAAGTSELAAVEGVVGAGGVRRGAQGALPKVRKADLLDKRGRVLQGAALDARMEKLARQQQEDKGPSGIIDALKTAGRSAVEVIKGGAALGVAVTSLGAGLAAATWIMGKAIPTFAKGLMAFNDVKGGNLIQVGLGMAGLGVGVLAMAAGTVTQAMGNIVKYFTGGEDPLNQAAKMLFKLSKMELDRKKIEDNGMAMMAFAKAMAAISALGAVSGIANAVKGIYNGIAGLFGENKLPWADMEEFGKKKLDTARIKVNSEALAAFGKAMSSYKGSSNKQTGAAIADATAGFFKQTPPYQQMNDFSKLQVDTDNIKKNARAFKVFAEAIASYKGYGDSAGAAGTAIAEAVSGFFKSTPPYDQFVAFGELKINPKAVAQNATAFRYFAEAMAAFKGYGSPIGAIATALAGASDRFFKVKPPLEKAVYFSHLNIDPKKTKINADAFILFSHAMASYKGGQGLIGAVSTIAASKLNSLFGEDSAIDAFVSFSKKDFGPNAEKNSIAFLSFAKAMNILSGGSSEGSALQTAMNIGAAVAGTIGGLASGAITGAAEVASGAAESAGRFIASAAGGIGDWVKDTLFRQGVNRIAQKWKVDASDLLGMMASESGLNPAATNKSGGATGLIQFMPSTAAALGTSTAALRGMSRSEQLPYVEKFFSQMKLPTNATAGQMYATVFLPAYNRKPNNFVVARQGGPNDAGANKSGSWYSSNKGLDVLPPKGAITISDLGSRVNQKRKSIGLGQSPTVPQAREGGMFTGPRAGYPMEMHGTEMVIPLLSPNSILEQLTKSTSEISNLGSAIEEIAHTIQSNIESSINIPTMSNEMSFLNTEMIAVLSDKFDIALGILEDSDDTHTQILHHSTV